MFLSIILLFTISFAHHTSGRLTHAVPHGGKQCRLYDEICKFRFAIDF